MENYNNTKTQSYLYDYLGLSPADILIHEINKPNKIVEKLNSGKSPYKQKEHEYKNPKVSKYNTI